MVQSYIGVIHDPDEPEYDGHDVYWFSHMSQSFGSFLTGVGWKHTGDKPYPEGTWSGNPEAPNRTVVVQKWDQCWHGQCVNDKHEGNDHCDTTGRAFTAERASE